MQSNNSGSSNDPYTTFQGGVTATLRSWSALRTAVEQSWGGTESQSKAEDLRNNIFNFFDGQSSKPKMTQEELEDNLSSYMEEEFGIVLEDGSEIEISNLIWNMYEDCSKGDVRLAVRVVQDAIRAEVSMKTGNVKMPMNVIQSGEDGDDDDDEHMIDDVEQQQSTTLVGSSSASASANHPPHQPQQQPQQAMQIGMINTANNNNSIEDVVKTYYLSSSTLFGSPPKPKKELPPPRQLGEKPEEKPQPQVDDDGFAMVTTKKKKKGR